MYHKPEFGVVTFGDVTEDEFGRPLRHAQILRDIVEEALMAESAGLDLFGVGEHHREDFAVTAPELVLAAVASRTRRIRLGSAATVLGTDDPVRVFQRFSTLQAISNGRAEVMLGRGWFTEPFRLFGCELSDYGELFDEHLDLFAALLRRDVVSWRGKTRAPLHQQRIFPPLESRSLPTWIAVGETPASVVRAARYEFPMMLAVIGGDPQRYRPLVDLYRAAFDKLGRPVQQVGVHSNGYVGESDSVAREEFFGYYKEYRDRLGLERGWLPISREIYEAEVERGSLFVGSPETVAKKIATTMIALGASRFNLKYSSGRMPHDRLMRSLELLGRKAVPIARDILHSAERSVNCR